MRHSSELFFKNNYQKKVGPGYFSLAGFYVKMAWIQGIMTGCSTWKAVYYWSFAVERWLLAPVSDKAPESPQLQNSTQRQHQRATSNLDHSNLWLNPCWKWPWCQWDIKLSDHQYITSSCQSNLDTLSRLHLIPQCKIETSSNSSYQSIRSHIWQAQMMRRKWWKTESSENLGMAQLTASMLAGLAYSMYVVSAHTKSLNNSIIKNLELHSIEYVSQQAQKAHFYSNTNGYNHIPDVVDTESGHRQWLNPIMQTDMHDLTTLLVSREKLPALPSLPPDMLHPMPNCCQP